MILMIKTDANSSEETTMNENRIENIKPHNWKPGQSGNPKGKKPGSKNITSYLKEFLDKNMDGPKSPLTPDGGKMPAGQVVALRLMALALKGDLRAIQQLQDRVEGKPVQSIELEDKTPQLKTSSREDVFKKLDELEKTIRYKSTTKNN